MGVGGNLLENHKKTGKPMNEKENHWNTRKMWGTRKDSNEKTIRKSGNAGKPMEKTRKMKEKQYYQDEHPRNEKKSKTLREKNSKNNSKPLGFGSFVGLGHIFHHFSRSKKAQ